MNYEIWIVGDGGDVPDTVLGVIFRDPWMRPAVGQEISIKGKMFTICLLYTSPSPRDGLLSRMPSSA